MKQLTHHFPSTPRKDSSSPKQPQKKCRSQAQLSPNLSPDFPLLWCYQLKIPFIFLATKLSNDLWSCRFPKLPNDPVKSLQVIIIIFPEGISICMETFWVFWCKKTVYCGWSNLGQWWLRWESSSKCRVLHSCRSTMLHQLHPLLGLTTDTWSCTWHPKWRLAFASAELGAVSSLKMQIAIKLQSNAL